MMNLDQQIQENVFDYFKNVSDEIFVQVVDCLAYHQSTNNQEVSKLCEAFLSDNELSIIYGNYVLDLKEPRDFFSRTSLSERNIIDQIKVGLMSASHVRFKNRLQP